MNKLNTNKSSQKTKSIYLPAIISRTVSISIRFIGDNIKETLLSFPFNKTKIRISCKTTFNHIIL